MEMAAKAAEEAARKLAAEEAARRAEEKARFHEHQRRQERRRLRALSREAPNPTRAVVLPVQSPVATFQQPQSGPGAEAAYGARASPVRLPRSQRTRRSLGAALRGAWGGGDNADAPERDLDDAGSAGGADQSDHGCSDDSEGDDAADGSQAGAAAPSIRFGGEGGCDAGSDPGPLRFESSAASKGMQAHSLAASRLAEPWVPGTHWMTDSVGVAVPMRLTAERGALGFGTRVVLTDCGVVVDTRATEGCTRAAAACGVLGLPSAQAMASGASGLSTSRSLRASGAAAGGPTSNGLVLLDPASGQRVPLPEADGVFGSLLDGEPMSSGWLPASRGGCTFLPCLVRAAAVPGSWSPHTAVYSFRARAWLSVDSAASGPAAAALARVGASVTTVSKGAAASSSQPAMLVIGGAFPDLRGLVGAVEAVSMKDDPACEADVVLRSVTHKTTVAGEGSGGGGAHPSLRIFHSAAQTTEARVAVFGGLVPKPASTGPSLATLSSLEPSGDIWELDLPSRQWTRLSRAARGDAPAPRFGAAMAVVGDALVIAGGASLGTEGHVTPLHDVSVLSLTTLAWSQLGVSAHPLLGRSLRLGLCSAVALSLDQSPVIVLGGPTTGSADGQATTRGREPHVVVLSLPAHPLEDLAGAMQRLEL